MNACLSVHISITEHLIITRNIYYCKLRDKFFFLGIPMETVRLASLMTIHSPSFFSNSVEARSYFFHSRSARLILQVI